MRNPISKFFGAVGLLGALLLPMESMAITLSNEPLFLTGSVPPLVMLNISKDHQLSYKAYNDYSDLDADGTPETTYKNTIDYYGYFDNQKCYTYSTTNNRFVPAAAATGTNKHYCSSQWSGNFLNWVSMTRMDSVRKLLYGGMRSTDTSTLTVLERHYLPTDAHAYAKYYNGSDIASLTPFTGIATTPPSATSSTSRTIGSGSKTFTTTLTAAIGDQIKVYVTGNESTQWMIGRVSAIGTGTITVEVPSGSFASTVTSTNWTLNNLSSTGISICNLTKGGGLSQTNTNPPLMRVARGDFALWGANERWQCYWSGEKSSTQSSGVSNGNAAYFSGLDASAENPSQTTHGLGSGSAAGEYIVRVEACNSALLGQERCKLYGTSSYKPIGLLQNYGDNDQLYFGLMTGTFAKNISGGVLRKRAESFSSEVSSADGTFVAGANGIVHNMNRLRMYGYDYSDGTYIGQDSCTYQQTGLVLSGGATSGGSAANEGNCSSWGNPMSEIYLESLRYLGGKSANTAFASGTKDTTLGLTVASWTAPSSTASGPLNQNNFCAPLNVLNFNASVSSYDGDQMGGVSDLGASSTAGTLTTAVGSSEGINGQSWFVGNAGTATNELCTSKLVTGLGSIFGLCPEAPSQKGTYLMSGVAHYAKTHRIRSDLTVPAGNEYKDSLKVSTYGIALATNVPKIEVTVGGNKVTILPAYRLDVSSSGSGPFGGGTLVDFKIVTQTATYGKFYVNWEDSEMGGDYDQDMWGTIEYSVSGSNITITTDAVAASSANGQGFGYITSGTNHDGAHFHSGIYNFDYTDPTGVTGCSNCVLANAATSVTYSVVASAADLLKDPLWYTAKYGNFSDSNTNDLPDLQSEWDSQINSTSSPGSDGIPDNFFYVTNPLYVEKSLNAAFLKILKDSSASAVATNSSSLNTGSRIFQGRFSNSSWSGQLLSYRLDGQTGEILSAASPPPLWDTADTPYPEWDAGQQINTQVSAGSDTRLILTTGATGSGAEFLYGNLSTGSGGQQYALNQDAYSTQDNCGPERVAYIRGHSVNAGTGTFTCSLGNPTTPATIAKFRTRAVSVLGDVINSNPVFVGPPAAGYVNLDHPGYSAFKNNFAARKPILYAGANDGMLHGIDTSVDVATNLPTTDAGKEVLAYVPTMVYDKLSRLTDTDYTSTGNHQYFVDSSPMVADVCTANCTSSTAVWKTLLVSGLGAGGKGFFALNVTNPDVAAKDSASTPLFNAANAADIVQWEFKSDADLGFTFNNSPTRFGYGQAKQIAKFENNRWGVVVGNGYNSASGKAVLYVLFVQGPTGTGGAWQAGGIDYVRIEADAGPNNGLSTPVPFDSDGNGLADTVYAGDLKGNMWKFNLSASSAASWTSASLLYVAKDGSGNRQPIINSPEVTFHPVTGSLVLFGTGKFLETGDTTSTSVQSFYGVQDSGSTVSGRGELNPQTINTILVPQANPLNLSPAPADKEYRTVTPGCGASPLPACLTAPKGWYVDLPVSGERTTGTATLVSGKIFFNTFIPSVSPCEFGGTGWLMALNYLTGDMSTPGGTFDSNLDGAIDSLDTPVAGSKIGASLGGTTIVSTSPSPSSSTTTTSGGTTTTSGGNNGALGLNSNLDGSMSSTQFAFDPNAIGRINWREIVQ